ncbi:hypothetical protein EAI_11663 [Harpegnathos saltator]|uniref:Uncharacterized protein n=1 Tax=Harpegnathos saltator TaxID=610380 RepID=E2BQT1_HARSA|nr:hypothetical protein EAI_11663 [Harpegnathos saltator]
MLKKWVLATESLPAQTNKLSRNSEYSPAMEIWRVRLPEYARDDDYGDEEEDVSRLEAENSVSRRADGSSAENNKGTSPYAVPSEFVPLLSPFMQIERLIFSSAGASCQRVSRETTDRNVTRHAYPEGIAPVAESAALLAGTWGFREDDDATDGEEKSSMPSRSEKVAGKSDVSCKDTKVTSEAICEALQGLDRCCEAAGEDETDYQERDDAEEDEGGERASARCGSSLSSDEIEREDQGAADTTDPLLAHELLVPYSCMPRPRLSRAIGEDAEYTITALPRRPRSPVRCGRVIVASIGVIQFGVSTDYAHFDRLHFVHQLPFPRHILPGRFDLRPRTAELLKRRGVARARRYLWETKVRISQSVKQLSTGDVDRDSIICTLLLQALCEQVTLTAAGANTATDVRTFVNAAIIWALADLRILDLNTLDTRERSMLVELGVEFSARPEFDLSVSTQLPSPWTPVNPAHHRGAVKSYANVRQRINERLPDEPEYARSIYVPDLTCCHIKEVSNGPYVARKRKSKLLSGPSGIDRELDELLAQLLSFSASLYDNDKTPEDFSLKFALIGPPRYYCKNDNLKKQEEYISAIYIDNARPRPVAEPAPRANGSPLKSVNVTQEVISIVADCKQGTRGDQQESLTKAVLPSENMNNENCSVRWLNMMGKG